MSGKLDKIKSKAVMDINLYDLSRGRRSVKEIAAINRSYIEKLLELRKIN